MECVSSQRDILQITGGKIIPEMTIPESSTILDLKEVIKELTNVDVVRQTLKFNNEELMNDKTIADYHDIKFSPELVLEVTPLPGEPEFNILVIFCGQEAKLNVKETTSVAELREKIGSHWGIPSNNATLYIFEYIKMEDDDAPLSAYYFGERSQVEVKVIPPP